jgi:hypothetical protein
MTIQHHLLMALVLNANGNQTEETQQIGYYQQVEMVAEKDAHRVQNQQEHR